METIREIGIMVLTSTKYVKKERRPSISGPFDQIMYVLLALLFLLKNPAKKPQMMLQTN